LGHPQADRPVSSASSHRPSCGYCRGKNVEGRKLPVPDPQKAEAVRTIFSLMASGEYTLDTFREKLLREGRPDGR